MLKPIIIALALLTAASPALANSQKLPFVGTRYAATDDGALVGYKISINKNGNTIVVLTSNFYDDVMYKGKYQQFIPINGPSYRTYLQIKNNKAYFLDRNKNLVYNCSFGGDGDLLEDQPCIIPLRK